MKWMLLFNLAIATPDGGAQDEIINVYSKHFDSQAKCEQFLENYEGLIHGRGLKSFQSMFKEGYTVTKLNVWRETNELFTRTSECIRCNA